MEFVRAFDEHKRITLARVYIIMILYTAVAEGRGECGKKRYLIKIFFPLILFRKE